MRVTSAFWLSLLISFGVGGCMADMHDDPREIARAQKAQESMPVAAAETEPATDPSADLATDDSAVTDDSRGGRLRYRQIDITAGPSALDGWSPIGLSDRADVYGQGFDCDDLGACTYPLLKRRTNGQFVTLAPSFLANDVNKHGDVGGCVVTDPVTLNGQAAIVRSNGRLELIPPLPGEVSSCVIRLSDERVVVVTSLDAASTATVYVRDGHRVTPFTVADASIEDVNDRAQVTGTIATPDANRAYRFDSRSQTTTILEPVSSDQHSWGQALNKSGEVLGYSFNFDSTERVGKWNRRNTFEVYFVEGTPEYPTVSNRLVWNERGLIIISYSLNDPNTYLVPQPGVRLALADLVVNGPVGTTLYVYQVNNNDDFVATSLDDGRSFLYLRK